VIDKGYSSAGSGVDRHRSRVGVAHWNQAIGTRNHGMGEWWRTAKGRTQEPGGCGTLELGDRNHGMGEWWRTAKGRRPTWAERHNVVLRRARSTTTRGSEQACGQSWRRTRGRGRPQ
jgi:hypothetical protein